uniref:Uncharacterized protein n=1 Tax=Anguilla anguilla TaxID=7936 RepID=A0A0E9WWN3_ANGAN
MLIIWAVVVMQYTMFCHTKFNMYWINISLDNMISILIWQTVCIVQSVYWR